MTPSAEPLDNRSRLLRRAIIDTLAAGGRGHLGPALSLVEILRVLYDDVLRYDAARPDWPQRDRFILSKGHGCLALYVLLAEKGFFARESLATFCSADSILGGHPERGKIPGIEASTGSLGHGLSLGIGMALAARIDRAGHRVFVVVGDGEINEGTIWEAALCAGKHRLQNLTVLIDYNKMQSWGPTREIQDLEPLAEKWQSFGFAVSAVNGHSVAELQAALTALPLQKDKPGVIICHTIKGKGIPSVEGNLAWHHKSSIGNDVHEALLRELEAPR